MENLISIFSLGTPSGIDPLSIFIRMAHELGITECRHYEKQSSYCYEVTQTEATPEFIEAVNTVAKINHMVSVPCKISRMYVFYAKSREGNESLILKSYSAESIACDHNRVFHSEVPYIGGLPVVEIHIYDHGVAWNYTKKKSGQTKVKGFPCSMKDFFYYQSKENIERRVFMVLFHAWGVEYPIWRDLANDFEAGTAYSSIPLDVIFSCSSRRELIEKRYHNGMKRNNAECIGDAIFICRAARLVEANQLQKLYGFHCYPCFIGRKKADMINPLAYYLHKTLKLNFPDMKVMRKRNGAEQNINISKSYLVDAITMSIKLKRRIPLDFRSLKTVVEWHDRLAIDQRNRSLPAVKIPKDSKFKHLTMPENCIRLTNRRMFAEEGNYQNNCVTSYIDQVNQDECSIWSMHKEDGSRNTIEIRIRTSKNFPNGYFYLRQMRGFDNEECSDEDWTYVSEALKGQEPEKRPAKRKNRTSL